MDATAAISAPRQVIDALQLASARTGEDFDYLYRTALRESGLKSTAKAPTSSASGLFQFVEQTWLATFKEAGPRHGLSAFSDSIAQSSGGQYIVADPNARQEILALRNNPKVAAVMAGELTAANRAELAQGLGRAPTDGELYIGHFLGSTGAVRLIRAAAFEPQARAAELFPAAARANPTIFYDRDGGARNVGEVYVRLVERHMSSAAEGRGEPASPVPVSGTREENSPFAGVIAFFDRLFSGDAFDRHTVDVVTAPSGPGPRSVSPDGPANSAAVLAYGPDQDVERAGGNLAQLLGHRQANEAYRAQASLSDGKPGADGLGVARNAGEPRASEPRASGSRASELRESDAWKDRPWGGGLFTNTHRPAGPLVLFDPANQR